MKRILVLTALPMLAWSPPLAARDGEVRTVRLRAICFEHVDDLRELHVVVPEGKPRAVPVPLFTTTYSDEVEVPVSGDRIHFAVEDAASAAPEGYRVIASARAVEGDRQLALVLPGDSPEKPYRCLVLDDSLKNFPMGSSLAVNLAPTAFRFAIGEHVRDLQPGRIGKIPMARKTNDRGQVSVIISIADPQQPDQWRAVNQTRWFSGTDKRDLLISFLDPKSGRPTVRCYADSPATDPGR